MTKEPLFPQLNQLIQLVVITGGAMTFNQWMMLCGMLFSGGSFFVNWYYKRQEHKLNSKQLDKGSDE